MKRLPSIPPPVPASDVQAPIEAEDLFPDAMDEPTAITSVQFDLRPRHNARPAAVAGLSSLFDDVLAGKGLANALVIGQPGMGKSHVIAEFKKNVLRKRGDVSFLVGRPEGSSYGAAAAIFHQRFGIAAGDGAEESREKIIEGVSEVLQASQVTEVAHLIANLCRVPFPHSPVIEPLAESPQRLESRTFLAIRRLLAADADRFPLILCIENLDECGAETINLLRYLSVGLASKPVMLLGTGRPRLFDEHPSMANADPAPKRIDLGPLSAAEAKALLRAICAQLDDVPDILLQHAGKLGGSPRAVFELVRLLLESEVIVREGGLSWKVDHEILATIRLPESHEELVAERVRVMAVAEADILQKAGAIGETFWLDAVVALIRCHDETGGDPDGPTLSEIASAGDHVRVQVSQTVANLVEREWFVEVAESSLGGELEYRFAYPYLWSSVYDNIQSEARARYHGHVAQFLELRPAEDRHELQEEVGRHLELAGNSRGAARAYRLAADLARGSFDNEQAIHLYGRALACLGEADLAGRIHLWHDLGSVYELTGEAEAALGAFERMLRLSWIGASRSKAAVAFNKMGRVWRRKGDLPLALEYLERGRDLFGQAHDQAGIAASLDDIGQVLYLLGRYDEAFGNVTEGLARRGKRGNQRSIAQSLSTLGKIQMDRGHLEEALNCHREALQIRRDIGDRVGVVGSLNNLAVLSFQRSEIAAAKTGWLEALTEAEDIGSLGLQAVALSNLGELARTSGNTDEARRRLTDAIELSREIDDPLTGGESARNLALLEHAVGNTDVARELAEHAFDTARAAGLRDNEGRALLTLGEVHTGSLFDDTDVGGPSKADDYFARGIEILREIGNDSEMAKGLDRYGMYNIESGKPADGRRHLEEALSHFKRLGMRQQEQTTAKVLAAIGRT